MKNVKPVNKGARQPKAKVTPKAKTEKYLNEAIAVRQVAAGRVKLTEAADALCEAKAATGAPNVGAQVYVVAGPASGHTGKFVKEVGGYAEVDCGNAGKFNGVPVVFLQKV